MTQQYMTRRVAKSLKAVPLLALAALAVGCEDMDETKSFGNWLNAYSYFPGTPRGGAVCFQIEVDDTIRAFIGTGANTNKTEEQERFRDFYMVSLNRQGQPHWTSRFERLYSEADADRAPTAQKYYRENVPYNVAVASMPQEARPRNGGVGFSINGKGYVGLGYDGVDYLKDFWCYDPATNSWTKAPEYPGDAVRYATSFVIDNVAYVGGGEDYDSNILGDFYRFDGTTWTAIQSIGVPRTQATSFVCNGYGYVFGGTNGGVIDAFQRYNPRLDSWESMRNLRDQSHSTFDDEYAGLARIGATSFVLYDGTENCRAYVALGTPGSGNALQTWEYNPMYDYWVPRSQFEAQTRRFPVSFVLEGDVDNRGVQQIPYVTTGASNNMAVTGENGNFFAETYLFQPGAYYESRD